MSLYEHVPHPRIEARKHERPPTVHEEHLARHGGWLARLNARFGLLITLVVGTMWCAYLFTLLALVSLPAALKTGDKIVIISWIAQTFLQLVLLPIIIVGQNVQATASDKRSRATYQDAEAVLHEAVRIQEHLQAQDLAIELILEHLGLELPPRQPAA
jgi:hypothetical protein